MSEKSSQIFFHTCLQIFSVLGRGHGGREHGDHQLLAADAAAAELGPGGGTYLHISTEYLDISIEYLHTYTEYLLDI